MNNVLPSFLRVSEDRPKDFSGRKKQVLPFIDKTLSNVAGFVKTAFIQSDTALKNGFLQQLNAGVKVIFLFLFIILISITGELSKHLFITSFLITLFILSRVNLFEVYKKILLFGFLFGFLVVVPASLNIITKGKILVQLIHFSSSHSFWIYHIPKTIGITYEGCVFVLKFFLKVTNSISLTLLVLYTTPFNEIIKAFDIFKVPHLFLMIITLTHKFIFILSQTTEETYFALKSRWWRHSTYTDANNLVAGRIGYIFRKSWIKYEEINKSMISRGFTGKVILCYPKSYRWRDAAFLFIIITVAVIYFYI